ncbi:hypothetical protein L3Q82_001235 [Scortum barcoo]|uniref:Uncharacterized protein n=1 Tax=Scortum barcoo TaxID=214431 RepID=A0ACB8W6Y0_9TELE|nr:hypothetical protein L3Q82_001235 [Scortum barcoo]
MSFLRRLAGRSLRDRVEKLSGTQEDLGVELLLLRIERSQLRWLRHLFRMPPVYQPAYSYSQPAMEPLNTAQHASQGAPPLFSTHHGQQTAPVLSAPSPGYTPLPGAELLLATALGIPQPSLSVFESGRESDFALLKLALDNVLESNLRAAALYQIDTP